MTPDTAPHQTLPSWLAPAMPDRAQLERARAARRELDDLMFESLFEDFLDKVRENALGVGQLFNNDPREPDYKRFIAWVMRDEQRKSRYYEAKEVGAEVLEVEIPIIADAGDSLEDVNRSTLRINARKWLLGVWNRKRFGDVKQIDQNVTIDLSGAMEQAQARVDRARTVEGTVRRIE